MTIRPVGGNWLTRLLRGLLVLPFSVAVYAYFLATPGQLQSLLLLCPGYELMGVGGRVVLMRVPPGWDFISRGQSFRRGSEVVRLVHLNAAWSGLQRSAALDYQLDLLERHPHSRGEYVLADIRKLEQADLIPDQTRILAMYHQGRELWGRGERAAAIVQWRRVSRELRSPESVDGQVGMALEKLALEPPLEIRPEKDGIRVGAVFEKGPATLWIFRQNEDVLAFLWSGAAQRAERQSFQQFMAWSDFDTSQPRSHESVLDHLEASFRKDGFFWLSLGVLALQFVVVPGLCGWLAWSGSSEEKQARYPLTFSGMALVGSLIPMGVFLWVYLHHFMHEGRGVFVDLALIGGICGFLAFGGLCSIPLAAAGARRGAARGRAAAAAAALGTALLSGLTLGALLWTLGRFVS